MLPEDGWCGALRCLLAFLSSGAPVPLCPPGLGPLLHLKDALCLERGNSSHFCAPDPTAPGQG